MARTHSTSEHVQTGCGLAELGLRQPLQAGHKQSLWGKLLLHETLPSFSARQHELHDPYDRARLNVSRDPQSTRLRLVSLLPTAFDLILSDEAVSVAVGLRLGAALCELHTFVCSFVVSARGSNGLAFSLGFVRQTNQQHQRLHPLQPQ